MSPMSYADVAQSFWQKFPTLHQSANRFKADLHSWAIDEVLEEYLARLEEYLARLAGSDPELLPLTAEEVEDLTTRFWGTVTNRKKKHRRRLKFLLEEWPYQVGRPVTDMPSPAASVIAEARNRPPAQLEQAEKLAWVRSQVSD